MTKSQEEDLAIVTAANSKVTNLQSDDEGFLIPLKVKMNEETILMKLRQKVTVFGKFNLI